MCHQMQKHKTRNTFYWITLEVNTICKWNLASLCHITKEKKFIKKIHKNCNLKNSPRPCCVCNELGITSIGNDIFEASYLHWICNGKTLKICLNQLADLLRFLFSKDSLKIEKGLELVFRPHFSYNFLIKFFFCNIT